MINRFFSILMILFLAKTIFLSCNKSDGTLRIGVMLPLSGSSDVGWRKPIEWALENINNAGGVTGKRLELVYADIAIEDIEKVAHKLADDSSIRAVIGPDTSSGAFKVAPIFIKAKKTLITPSATSGDIFRAFGGQKYIWRTVESDIAQLETMLLIVNRDNIHKVALLTSIDNYGSTFFDWFGFFATELGLEITNIISYDQTQASCEPYVDQALAGEPDVLFVVPSVRFAALCITRNAQKLSPSTRLFFSDGGQFPDFIKEMGQDAEGLEGTAPVSDQSSGFEIAYRVIFNELPPAYAANIYDALLLVAFGLERSGGKGDESLADAMAEIVDARGSLVGWDEDCIREALVAIGSGKLPNITGASGPLDFDKDFHTDPISSTYGYWRIDHGEYVIIEFITTGQGGRSTSLGQSYASAKLMQELKTEETGGYEPAVKTGIWALIAATSSGWKNYRHQADALAEYQNLKQNGVSDEHIVFILADDLAYNQENSEPGVVRNVAGGPNLYVKVEIDYKLKEVNADDILNILAGKKSQQLPKVIDSTAGDNIFVFFVGHGNDRGIGIGGESISTINTDMLANTVSSMFKDSRYRRMLIVVEACYGGVTGTKLDAPGAVLFSGANIFESSFGANYDNSLKSWLADQFAYQFFQKASLQSEIKLDTLYHDLYLLVSGSHVTVYNNQHFGDVSKVMLEEFLEP